MAGTSMKDQLLDRAMDLLESMPKKEDGEEAAKKWLKRRAELIKDFKKWLKKLPGGMNKT